MCPGLQVAKGRPIHGRRLGRSVPPTSSAWMLHTHQYRPRPPGSERPDPSRSCRPSLAFDRCGHQGQPSTDPGHSRRAASWPRRTGLPQPWLARLLVATSVLITRTATDRVVKVNRLLSQISARVAAARETAARVLRLPRGDPVRRAAGCPATATPGQPAPVPPTASTSLVSAACAAYRSSRSADRAADVQRSSRGSAVMRSRSLPSCSRSASRKYTAAVSSTPCSVAAALVTMSNAE